MLTKNTHYILKTGERDGSQEFAPISNQYSTKPYTVREITVDPKRVLALHASFDVSSRWIEGEVKKFTFYGIMEAIKIDSTNTPAGIVFVPGMVLMSLEGVDHAGYLFMYGNLNSMTIVQGSYGDGILYRSYNVDIKLIRLNGYLKIISVEYSIPYFTNTSEGVFTFKSSTASNSLSNQSETVTNSIAPFGKIFENSDILEKFTLTMGVDWIPDLMGSTCTTWNAQWAAESDRDMYLNVSTLPPVIDSHTALFT